MPQPQFHFLSFETSPSSAVTTLPSEDALFIFPTEASKRAALREFQRGWRFENAQFLTMEEWKESLLDADRPLLKEEKRTLAFYAALSDDDKAALKINNYFQSIEPAQRFFDLWEEFNEELLPDELDHTRLAAADAELLGWQRGAYETLLTVKRRYNHFLTTRGLDDPIFLLKPERLDFESMTAVRRVCFVNQFYYTTLEKRLIERLLELGKAVTLIYQLPPELVDRETLEIRPFTVRDLGSGRNESIEIIECPNETAMLATLLQRIDGDLRHVVNFSERREPLSRLLAPARFDVAANMSVESTSIFSVFDALHRLLAALIWEPQRGKILLPLQACLDALLDTSFSRMVCAADARRRTLDDLYTLIAEQVQFIDLDGEFFYTMPKRAAEPTLRALLALIERVLTVHTLGDWVALIDAGKELVVADMLTDDERPGGALLETFYRALADFEALQAVGLIDDWEPLFRNRYLPPQAQTPVGILKLFLDYLRSRRFRRQSARSENPRVEFTNLLDTRNLSYQFAAVMNVVEKQIPHARQTPFLFSEKQRRALGLKTYDDVKLREKYYFMRLVLTSSHIVLLTQRNLEQNVEVSSFVEELRLLYDPARVRSVVADDTHYPTLYSHFCRPDAGYAAPKVLPENSDFYTLPFDRTRDLPHASLDLSYYRLEALLKNPFSFYVRFIAGVDERAKRIEHEVSALLLGQIVHDILNRLWQFIGEEHPLTPLTLNFARIPEPLLERALRQTLRNDRLYYRLPHNHSEIYFLEIVLPQVMEGVRGFFKFLHRIGLSDTPLLLFPEKIDPTTREPFVTFITSEKTDFQVRIGGRADLRIEAPERGHHFIFDYKTGGSNENQLIFYELYYYLVERPDLREQVSSFFCQILEARYDELRELKRKYKEEMFQAFEQNIREAVVAFWQRGFGLPEKRSDLQQMQEISRSDLYDAKILAFRDAFGL